MSNSFVRLPATLTLTQLPDRPGIYVACLNEKYFELSGISLALVLSIDEMPVDSDRLIERLSLEAGTSQELYTNALRQLVTRGVICETDTTECLSSRDQEAPSVSKKGGFLSLKATILPASVVQHLSRLLEPFLGDHFVTLATPLLILSSIVAFCTLSGGLSRLTAQLSAHDIVWVVALNYGALLLHEVGHAAACKRNGSAPGAIGFGIYLIFPVLFTDVSVAWKMSRQKRLIVDGSGLYISGILAALAWSSFYAWRSPVLGVVAFLITLTIIANLNPFIRMDGYWLLSDALNIPNLMDLNRQMNAWVLGSIRRFQTQKVPFVAGSDRRTRLIYYAYYGGTILFGAYFLWSIAVKIVPESLVELLERWREFEAVRSGGVTVIQLLVHSLATAMIVVPLLMMIFQILKGISKAAQGRRPVQVAVVDTTVSSAS